MISFFVGQGLGQQAIVQPSDPAQEKHQIEAGSSNSHQGPKAGLISLKTTVCPRTTHSNSVWTARAGSRQMARVLSSGQGHATPAKTDQTLPEPTPSHL